MSNVSPIDKSPSTASEPFWPNGWWKLMETRIGVVPIPVFIVLLALILGFVATNGLLPEINVTIAILAVGGFACAEVGKRIPGINRIGAAAIFATFIPSALVFYKVIPDAVVKNVTDFTKGTNFLYLFICSIIVGSIFSMDRGVLVKGFLKIFVPLALGTVVAAIVGTAVGTLLGLGAKHTFFFIVVPIMAGGVGEGAIPLSMGYADILHGKQGDLFAEVLPIVMLGSLTAILASGALNALGKKYPHLTGEGRLQPGEHDEMEGSEEEVGQHVDVSHICAAGLTAIMLYLIGLMAYKLFGFPAAVSMLFIAVLAKLANMISPPLRQGAYAVYKFFSVGVTYPLLFAIGVAMTPWDKLVAAFHIANLITIVATVLSLMATGYYVGRWMKMYPIETAIVNACHSGQGGTGDIAILTAANRMVLMPFASIATRIGGAVMVTVALIWLKSIS